MTATTAESTQMAHTPDPRPDPPAAAETDAAGAGARRWAILGDNPLLTLIATGIVTLLATGSVALLIFVLTNVHSRIDEVHDRIDEVHDRIDRLEDTMNARFAALEDTMNTRFAEQDAKIDEINLKLTALIAALNKTGEVDAAIEGRLLDSEPAEDDPGAVLG